MMKEILIVVAHVVIGWALCGATIGIGRNVTSMQNTLVIHAVAAPLIFALVSMIYFKRSNYFSPLFIATSFLVAVALLDFFVVALLIEKNFSMFRSILGTWFPFFTIFLSTFITGTIINKKIG